MWNDFLAEYYSVDGSWTNNFWPIWRSISWSVYSTGAGRQVLCCTFGQCHRDYHRERQHGHLRLVRLWPLPPFFRLCFLCGRLLLRFRFRFRFQFGCGSISTADTAASPSCSFSPSRLSPSGIPVGSTGCGKISGVS